MTAPTPAPPPPPAPPVMWFADTYRPDADARIYALQSLMKTDAEKVIPMLKEIALHGGDPSQARRAVFVLAQSNRPEARSTVFEIARSAAEPVRIAAVRELGRLGGPTIATELLQVYSSGNARVKYQVVNSLGERAATDALFRIAESEKEGELRDFTILALGEAGGRRYLSTLYSRAPLGAKRAIIRGLFNARGDEELIAIARKEQDTALRQEVLTRLRLLGTPQARQYLQQVAR